MARAQQVAYVANLRAASVSVIDVATRRVTGRIAVGADPDGLGLSPDGSRLYVANFASDTVSVIDTATRTVVASLTVDAGPVGLAVSPSGVEVYVASKTASIVSVVDTGAGTVVATVPLVPGSAPNSVAFTPDGAFAYVTNSRSSSVSVIDTETRQVVKTLSVQRGPSRVVVHPTRALAFVANHNADSISVIDTALVQVSTTIEVGLQPTGLALTPDGSLLYVAGEFGVRAVDVATLTPLDAVEGEGPNGSSRAAALATDGTYVYVTSLLEGTTDIVDGAQNRVVGAICVDSGPFVIAIGAPPTAPPLVWITQPLSGTKVHAGNREPVRLVVRAGETPISSWRLRLIEPDGTERELASGSAAVGDAVVAEIDGRTLLQKGTYSLLLDVDSTDAPSARSGVQLVAPDPHFALLPVAASVGAEPFSFEPVQVDGSGGLVLFQPAYDQANLLQVVSGQLQTIDLAGCCGPAKLSQDATTLVASSYGNGLLFDDLATGGLSSAPITSVSKISIDRTGLRLSLTHGVPSGDPDVGYRPQYF